MDGTCHDTSAAEASTSFTPVNTARSSTARPLCASMTCAAARPEVPDASRHATSKRKHCSLAASFVGSLRRREHAATLVTKNMQKLKCQLTRTVLQQEATRSRSWTARWCHHCQLPVMQVRAAQPPNSRAFQAAFQGHPACPSS